MSIDRFEIRVGDALDDLRDRLRRTRWPEGATTVGWAQGPPTDYMRELCVYWAEEYDWRQTEARLNSRPQFRTEIEASASTSSTCAPHTPTPCRWS